LTEFVNQHVRDGRRVALWHMESSWIDVGTPAELSRARGER
jgi:NDP-sugar pyrophosphorylase family protein